MGGAVCRRLALTAPGSGTLQVSISSAPALPFDVSVLRPDGTVGIYGGASATPVQVSLPVSAGLTYQVDVVHISPAAREFDLTTSLR
jgi:predicted phage gp36 major capsid-like protein